MHTILPITVFAVIGAYLLGSISSAVIICWLFRLPDPRVEGSGNPGTTNVLRVGGKFPAALTLLGDSAKGFIPLALMKTQTDNPWVLSLVFAAVVIGHMFPVFFRFKGGKGVATAVGGFWGLSWWLGALFMGVWSVVFLISRYSSLSALIAMIIMPMAAAFWLNSAYGIGLSFIILLIIWRHQSNIQRLIQGTESKFDFRKNR